MIGIDWGTTSLRAYRLRGGIVDRRESQQGIVTAGEVGFERVLRATIGDWLAEGETDVLLAGMIGSRQGWIEAPYLPCPAGAAELAAALTPVPLEGVRAAIVPGLADEDATGTPEVMRGEETQLVSALLTSVAGDACLPGTHSKWVRCADGQIVRFATHMTGEVFAALRGHTILGRMMRDGPTDVAAFGRGVARSAEPGGLLHHLFGVRTLGLFGRLDEAGAASYLSGLLIGHEIGAAAPNGTVTLIGAPALCALYGQALAERGVPSVMAPDDLAARGLALVAECAGWR